MQSGCVKVRVGMIRAAMAVIACVGILYASLMAADDTPSSVLRSRVYRIKYIAPERAKQILMDLKLGNEISLLQQNAIIVTAYSSVDLVKTTAVIGLVDSKTAYEIRTFGIPTQMLAEIQDKTLTVSVESLQVGTLRDAPMSKTEPGAIIDIHNEQLLVIAPKASMDKIAQELVRLEEPYITKPSEGTAENTATVEQILPATLSATKVEPFRLMPDADGAAMFPNLMALAEQWMASDAMDQPTIEAIGPVAPKETTTPTTGAKGLEELIAPTPQAASVPAGETEDELIKVLEQMSGRNTATATAEAPAGEQQVDDAIAKAIEAEKKAQQAEQQAAEAEARAQQAQEALAAAKTAPPAAPAPAATVPAAAQPAAPTTPPPAAAAPAPAPVAEAPAAPAPAPQPDAKAKSSAADELLKIAGGDTAAPAPVQPTPAAPAPAPAAPQPVAPVPAKPATPAETPAATPVPVPAMPAPATPVVPVAEKIAVKPAEKPAEVKPAEPVTAVEPKSAESAKPVEAPAATSVPATPQPAPAVEPNAPAAVAIEKPAKKPAAKPKPADQAVADKPSEAEAELLKAAESAADAELATALKQLAAMTREAEQADAAAAEGQPTAESVAAEAPAAEQPKPAEKPQAKPPVETAPVKPTEAASPDTKAKPKAADSKIEAAEPAGDGKAGIQKDLALSDEELELTLTLPEKVDILALIELVGKQLKLNYMFDPTKIRGDVLLKVHDGKIKVRDTYALLETVLKYKGFVMTRRGNLVTIVPVAEALGQDPAIRREGESVEPGDIVITGVFNLKYITTQSAENMLKNMQLGNIFNSVPETQTLIVTDYAYRMERIRQLLDLVDIEGKKKRVEERFIKFYKASEMAPKVETMAGHLGTVSVSVSAAPAQAAVPPQPTPGAPASAAAAAAAAAAERARQAAAAAARGGGGQPAAAEDSVQLETDDRTNRLFIIGTDEKIQIVNEIIDSLDIPQKSIRSIEEYKIQFIDTEEVVNTLFELGVIRSKPTSQTQTSTATMARPRTPTPGVAPPMGGGGGAAGSDNEPMISIRQSTNSLLINATDEQHADIALVIAQIDTEQSNKRTVQEYEIQFVDTAEIVQTLEELAIIAPRQQQSSRYGQQSSPYSRTGQQQGSMTNPAMPGGAAGAQPTPQPTATVALTGEPTTAEDIVAEQPQIAVLESTNSLLVNATPRQHAAIALVIAHVDREPETTSTPYVVYPLENQDPEELAAVLDELVNATIQAEAQRSAPRSTTSTTGTTPLGTAGTTGPESRIQTSARPTGMGGQRSENEVTIVPDKASYSLIVYGNKKNQQWISQLIKVLDDYRPQVLLDVTLVEINKDNIFTMDLNLVSKYPRLAPGGTMTGPTGGGTTGTPYITPLVTPFPADQILEGSVSNGSGIAFYADQHIQALLELMDRKRYGRVLARPSLLVKDNQEGQIKAEKTIYVGEQKSIVNTPAQGDAITTSDIQFKDYKSGITLTITPHIATKDVLQLKIELDRTDFVPGTGEAQFGDETVPKPLDTVSSNVGTMAVLPDGATIILGGIETMSQNKGTTKVPLLGDIPIIGMLFRGVSESDIQSRLYVFVKANIIRPGDELTGDSDIERISRKKREAFERDETTFQGLDSIPGIKPGKIQPEKILEDDEYIQSLRDRLDQKRRTKDKEPVKVEIKLD